MHSIISNNPTRGTAMIVTLTKLSNGKFTSRTRHVKYIAKGTVQTSSGEILKL